MYMHEYTASADSEELLPAKEEGYTLIHLPSTAPNGTDYTVKISDDSMEPYIKNGSFVYVSRTDKLADGDVGVFFVDGDMKCRQFCEDCYGNIYLFSLNRKRADSDVTVLAGSGTTVICLGKVLLPERPPLPL